MKRAVVLTVLVAGCGGDDTVAPDAFIPSGPEYNLQCLGTDPTTVANPLTVHGPLLDHTTLTMLTPVPDTEIRFYTVTDDALIGMGTTDDEGKYSFEVTTTGTPARAYNRYAATGHVPTRTYASSALVDFGQDIILASVRQPRLDALAAALGATLDPTKGVLEVWSSDCSKGELPGATLQLDNATDTQWAMYGGSPGSWIPRAITIGHPPNILTGSIAGTVNVTPGVHNVTVTAGSLQLGPFSVNVEAGGFTVLHVTPHSTQN